MKKYILLFLAVIASHSILAQEQFTRKDSLQGGLRKERTSFDVLRYDLTIKVDVDNKFISGSNTIEFEVVQPTQKIQIDLFKNMQVDSIVYQKTKLSFQREYNAVFIQFPSELRTGSKESIQFYYSGKPIIAKNAPWDGGFVFKKDAAGKPWIGVAVQGTGASLWYPVKDSQSDEPNYGASIKVAVPSGLMNVSNGRFLGSEDLKNGYTRWDWEVKSPINTYDITLNIADYVHIHDALDGLDLDYYVLRENEEIAKKHFVDVKPMLTCFQSKFGTYPFANDGYKLVDTPYLGMEHQSAVAYGNKYRKGYLGSDLSHTGIGLLFDYIIVHESGHEWFGNSITSKDIADMWIHEGFTMYSEVVFLECNYGKEKATTYINGLKANVDNDKPIIGQYGVNNEGSGDMYPKGALMLHTIRNIINNDDKWWAMLLKYSENFRHKIIDTQTVLAFFNKETGLDFSDVFNQYLKTTSIPELELRITNKSLEYKWNASTTPFTMPVDVFVSDKKIRLFPTTSWQKLDGKVKKLEEIKVADDLFFINVKRNELN
jgi:aminopeptidase N